MEHRRPGDLPCYGIRAMSPELKHLRYFVAVAEDLSFSGAARRLFVSQQALSRIIQQLERELGVRLFERTTRSVRLTRAGELVLDPARRSIAAADDAFDAARRAARGDFARPLRVDIASGGIETGATILRQLRHEHPQLPVQQREEGVPHGLIALQEGTLDVLLGLATYCPPDVSAEVVRQEPLLVGMAADHPMARLDAVPVAALAGTDLLLPSDDAALEWVEFVWQFCRRAGVTPRRWPGTTHGSTAAAEVLREGTCVVPTARWTEPPADIVFRPLVEPTPVFEWSIMTARGGGTQSAIDAFIRSARAVSRENNWQRPTSSVLLRDSG